ncbi:MAG TPA: acetyltransferase [Syntrophomonadaceae bacterium]|nr:acetyltransferase [Syntrophomonadaceae bacterium]
MHEQSPPASMHLFPRIYATSSAHHWICSERYQVERLQGVTEPFCSVNEQLDPYFKKLFTTARPPASDYLLHRAPGWDSNLYPVPVLLVHGAALDASSFTDLFGMGLKGLQQHLVALGHRVFALTFSHSHGNNLYQAEQLAAAIEQVKTLCQVQQLDLVVHSKGGIPARIYLSDLAAAPYRGDVRRLIMLGVPNLGTDYAFRNPAISYFLYLSGGNGVIAWDKIMHMGLWKDTCKYAIYSDGSFPGQRQLLQRWDDEYALDVTQIDWWTSYYGGTGYISHSRGIDVALQEGQEFMQWLNRFGLDAGIEVAMLAGNNHYFGPFPGESTGESDGVIFVQSALDSESILQNGATLLTKEILPVNHLELLFKKRVAHWVHQQLLQ